MNRLIGGFVRKIVAGAGINVSRSGGTVTVSASGGGGSTTLQAEVGGTPLSGTVVLHGGTNVGISENVGTQTLTFAVSPVVSTISDGSTATSNGNVTFAHSGPLGISVSGQTVTFAATPFPSPLVNALQAVDGSGQNMSGIVPVQGQQGIKVKDSSPGVGPLLVVAQYYIQAGSVIINGNGSTLLFTGISMGITLQTIASLVGIISAGAVPATKGIQLLHGVGPLSTFDVQFDSPPPVGTCTIDFIALGTV